MREFTDKEKEIIIKTPILKESFDMHGMENINPFEIFGRKDCNLNVQFELFLTYLEELRHAYKETKNEKYFDALVRMLPISYKPVNLLSERKE